MARRKIKTTHVRIAQSDKRKLEAFMRQKHIKGQAAALRLIFRRMGL